MSGWTRQDMARRIAREFRPGDVVNLGIGMPTLVADYCQDDVFLHTENGLLGVGPSPSPEEIDHDLVNASKKPVTALNGASYFDSAASFGMIRGGHVHVAVLGGLQVDETGLLANWAYPGKAIFGVGGAMDLSVGARFILVARTHSTPQGDPKLVKNCTYPLTSGDPIHLVVTNLAVFAVKNRSLQLIELAPGVSLEQVQESTTAAFTVCLEAGASR